MLTQRLEMSDHEKCDPLIFGGCTHCQPQSSSICCDLCHPSYFQQFEIEVGHQPPMPCQSVIKPFEMDGNNKKVKEALLAWHHQQALKKLGSVLLWQHGAKYLMGEKTIDHLVACIHMHKIKTICDICKETGWRELWV